MEEHGTLTVETLEEVYKTLSQHQFTGSLAAYDEKAWKEFYFASSGVRVTSVGEKKSLALGEILVRMAIIRPKDQQEAAARLKEKPGLFGETLMDLGSLHEDDLHRGLVHQAELELLDLYFWRRPTYEFRPGLQSVRSPMVERKRAETNTKSLSLQIHPLDIIQSTRVLYREVADIRSRVSRSRDVYCLSEKGRAIIFKASGFSRLSVMEQKVIILLDGRHTLGDLFKKARVLWIDVIRVLDKLMAHGAVKRK